MHKKLELFVPRSSLEKMLEALEGAGLHGYTVQYVARGRSAARGTSMDFGMGSLLSAHVMAVADGAAVDSTLDTVGPMIEKIRGFAFVTPVERVLGHNLEKVSDPGT